MGSLILSRHDESLHRLGTAQHRRARHAGTHAQTLEHAQHLRCCKCAARKDLRAVKQLRSLGHARVEQLRSATQRAAANRHESHLRQRSDKPAVLAAQCMQLVQRRQHRAVAISRRQLAHAWKHVLAVEPAAHQLRHSCKLNQALLAAHNATHETSVQQRHWYASRSKSMPLNVQAHAPASVQSVASWRLTIIALRSATCIFLCCAC